MSTRRIAALHKVPRGLGGYGAASAGRRSRLVAASSGDRAHAERVAREVERAELAEQVILPPVILEPGRSRPRAIDGFVVIVALVLGLAGWAVVFALSWLVWAVALR